eukprot:Protomagalhaensia_sp_Gyna_25__5314@NODE_667_length_2877_cov_177_423538_g521_i0_p3_GENE_NODE_667_length_2877_cov_177_423538_g521_i0NODE_667_length_2877_cov_177_423538_g521_i0_p3_ORF_typecomplete_len120_score12_41_NODE_667_length_2877_cov_177_423538_g521_i0323682
MNGLQAILNCRMYFSMCCSGGRCPQNLLPKDVYQCNYPIFLDAYGFFKNPIAMDVASRICDHINNLVEPAQPFCTPPQTEWECFGDDKDISDFGKTFILYTVWSSLSFISTTVLFGIVK